MSGTLKSVLEEFLTGMCAYKATTEQYVVEQGGPVFEWLLSQVRLRPETPLGAEEDQVEAAIRKVFYSHGSRAPWVWKAAAKALCLGAAAPEEDWPKFLPTGMSHLAR